MSVVVLCNVRIFGIWLMIVLYKYKFIFVKIMKIVGMSIEIVFFRFCGFDDVIMLIGEKDEVKREEFGLCGL